METVGIAFNNDAKTTHEIQYETLFDGRIRVTVGNWSGILSIKVGEPNWQERATSEALVFASKKYDAVSINH